MARNSDIDMLCDDAAIVLCPFFNLLRLKCTRFISLYVSLLCVCVCFFCFCFKLIPLAHCECLFLFAGSRNIKFLFTYSAYVVVYVENLLWKRRQQHIQIPKILRIRTDKWKLTTSFVYYLYLYMYIHFMRAEWYGFFLVYLCFSGLKSVWALLSSSLIFGSHCIHLQNENCWWATRLETPYAIAYYNGSTQWMHAQKHEICVCTLIHSIRILSNKNDAINFS